MMSVPEQGRPKPCGFAKIAAFSATEDISLRDFYRGVRAWALDGQFASWQ